MKLAKLLVIIDDSIISRIMDGPDIDWHVGDKL